MILHNHFSLSLKSRKMFGVTFSKKLKKTAKRIFVFKLLPTPPGNQDFEGELLVTDLQAS